MHFFRCIISNKYYLAERKSQENSLETITYLNNSVHAEGLNFEDT